MDGTLRGFDHPAWITAGATLVGYLVILGAVFLLLFAIPYALF